MLKRNQLCASEILFFNEEIFQGREIDNFKLIGDQYCIFGCVARTGRMVYSFSLSVTLAVIQSLMKTYAYLNSNFNSGLEEEQLTQMSKLCPILFGFRLQL